MPGTTFRTGLATMLATVLILGGGAAANAVVFGTSTSPLNLNHDNVLLGQGRGSVTPSGTANISATGLYQRDRKSNGDGVFLKIDTDYYAKYYDAAGRGPFYGNFYNVERFRTTVSTSSSWVSRTGGTKSVVSSSFYTLWASSHKVDVRVCEDRGILRADPCDTKTYTFQR